MKRVSRSQIAPIGDELIFRRRWTCGQADFCHATPDEQADFCLAAPNTKRLFLFARMWRLLLRIIPDGAVIYRPSRIFRDWLVAEAAPMGLLTKAAKPACAGYKTRTCLIDSLTNTLNSITL